MQKIQKKKNMLILLSAFMILSMFSCTKDTAEVNINNRGLLPLQDVRVGPVYFGEIGIGFSEYKKINPGIHEVTWRIDQNFPLMSETVNIPQNKKYTIRLNEFGIY